MSLPYLIACTDNIQSLKSEICMSVFAFEIYFLHMLNAFSFAISQAYRQREDIPGVQYLKKYHKEEFHNIS
jgi:hypothetical protein